MKVWVVTEGFDYEGCDFPFGIYSTKEKAEEARNKLLKAGGYSSLKEVPNYVHYDISEYTLDKDDDD